MKIGVIGSGISGLGCAYELNKHHDVTVFEAGPIIGGHTATKDIVFDDKEYAIETGFIVYNDWTYPNFIRLMDELAVENLETEMSFSVSCALSGLEYGGNNFNTLFAQRSNLFRPSYLGMLLDIVRFNKQAIADLDSGLLADDLTLGDYLLMNK